MTTIVYNAIRTPDGTVLESTHRHDYKVYMDKNGKEYMVDGGLDYLRRNVHDDAPYEELSVNADQDHLTIRKVLKWGTYGKNGNQPKRLILIKDMSTEHIQACLDTILSIHPIWEKAFNDELKLRGVV